MIESFFFRVQFADWEIPIEPTTAGPDLEVCLRTDLNPTTTSTILDALHTMRVSNFDMVLIGSTSGYSADIFGKNHSSQNGMV